MTEHKPRFLGLDDVEANALYAWQHGLLECVDINLLQAMKSVVQKAREKEFTKEELKQVPIDPAWIRSDLQELVKKGEELNMLSQGFHPFKR